MTVYDNSPRSNNFGPRAILCTIGGIMVKAVISVISSVIVAVLLVLTFGVLLGVTSHYWVECIFNGKCSVLALIGTALSFLYLICLIRIAVSDYD